MGTPKNYEINVISTQNEQGRIKESGEENTHLSLFTGKPFLAGSYFS